MTAFDIVNDPLTTWTRMPPADERAILQLMSDSDLDLPTDYLTFLRLRNGGEGELSIEPGWFQIWPSEEVMQANNDYIQEFVPGFFGFGSNGGGELLAFDTRTQQPWKVFMIPFVVMQEEDAIEISDSFISFLSAMGRGITGE